MQRPSFQFYPGDFQSNAKLRRCSWAAKGAWIMVMCLLHDSEEYGLLRWSLDDIALAVGCSIDLIDELVLKGVLKGVPKGGFGGGLWYTPRSGGKDGATVTIIKSQEGEFWYSSRMVEDEYKRVKRAECGKESHKNPNSSRKKDTPKGGFGIPSDIPPPSLSPAPPLSSTTSLNQEQNQTLKEKRSARAAKKEKRSTSAASFSQLPDFLLPHKALWDAYLDVRKSKRVPSTDTAIALCIARLERLNSDGYAPDAVLSIAVERGWAGLEYAENELTNPQQKYGNGRFSQPTVDESVDLYIKKRNKRLAEEAKEVKDIQGECHVIA